MDLNVCSAVQASGSATPHRKGKATNRAPDQTNPMKMMPKQKQVPPEAKKSMWVTPNKYA